MVAEIEDLAEELIENYEIIKHALDRIEKKVDLESEPDIRKAHVFLNDLLGKVNDYRSDEDDEEKLQPSIDYLKEKTNGSSETISGESRLKSIVDKILRPFNLRHRR